MTNNIQDAWKKLQELDMDFKRTLHESLEDEKEDDDLEVGGSELEWDADWEAPEGEDEEEVLIGKVVLDCCACHGKVFKNDDEVVRDDDEADYEEGEIVNKKEVCPFCQAKAGYTIIGQVEPFVPEDDEEEEEDVEEEDLEDVDGLDEALTTQFFWKNRVNDGIWALYARASGQGACYTDRFSKLPIASIEQKGKYYGLKIPFNAPDDETRWFTDLQYAKRVCANELGLKGAVENESLNESTDEGDAGYKVFKAAFKKASNKKSSSKYSREELAGKVWDSLASQNNYSMKEDAWWDGAERAFNDVVDGLDESLNEDMYRQYEDPYKLEKELEELRNDYEMAKADGDEDELMSLAERIAGLEERINFAWQDDEYDHDYDSDYPYYPELATSDLQAGQWYESLNEDSTNTVKSAAVNQKPDLASAVKSGVNAINNSGLNKNQKAAVTSAVYNAAAKEAAKNNIPSGENTHLPGNSSTQKTASAVRTPNTGANLKKEDPMKTKFEQTKANLAKAKNSKVEALNEAEDEEEFEDNLENFLDAESPVDAELGLEADNTPDNEVEKSAEDVMAAYQNANKWLDSVKEVLYTDLGCVFFSSYVHQLAHTMPERFDKFGDILHTVDIKVPYPATELIPNEPTDVEGAFGVIFNVLDNIKSSLNAFIKCTEDEYHGMACAAETLLNDIEEEYPMLYRMQKAYNGCDGDNVKFDKWVNQYVRNKDDLLESLALNEDSYTSGAGIDNTAGAKKKSDTDISSQHAKSTAATSTANRTGSAVMASKTPQVRGDGGASSEIREVGNLVDGGNVKSGTTSARTKSVQGLLSKLGYYSGELSGTADAATVQAIKDFQAANDLQVDGIVGQQTMSALTKAGNGVKNTETDSKVSATNTTSTPKVKNVNDTTLKNYQDAVAYRNSKFGKSENSVAGEDTEDDLRSRISNIDEYSAQLQDQRVSDMKKGAAVQGGLGALAGTAVGGPLGTAAGAATGAALGAIHGAVTSDTSDKLSDLSEKRAKLTKKLRDMGVPEASEDDVAQTYSAVNKEKYNGMGM